MGVFDELGGDGGGVGGLVDEGVEHAGRDSSLVET
jgi:hypothetical protein